jgi:hypothetical protein
VKAEHRSEEPQSPEFGWGTVDEEMHGTDPRVELLENRVQTAAVVVIIMREQKLGDVKRGVVN